MSIRLRKVLPGILVPGLLAWLALAAAASLPPNLDDALSAQRDLAAVNPGDARVLNDLGNLLVLTDRLIEAEETYARAVALSPDNPAIRYNHALVLQQLGVHKKAIAEYKVVLELDPNHAWSHYQLGTLYAAAGKRERAIRSYARALELDADLLSPEVNPHIIENRLVTPSLILARWGDSSTAMAPRLYQQPARITDLLVPPLPEPEEAVTTQTEEAPPRPEEEGAGASQELTETDLPTTRSTVNQATGTPTPQTETPGDLEDPGDEGDEEGERDPEAEDGGGEDSEDEPVEAATAGSGAQVLTADDLVPSFVGQVQPRGRAAQGSSGSPSGGSTAVRGRTIPPPTSGRGIPTRPPGVGDPGTGGGGTGTSSTGRLDLILLPDPQDRLAGGTAGGQPAG